MRKLLPVTAFSLGVGYALASFLAAFYGHWYFSSLYWTKVAVLGVLIAAVFLALLLSSRHRTLWAVCGVWWFLSFCITALQQWSLDLRQMSFTSVLDYEAAFIWFPIALLWLVYGWAVLTHERRQSRARRRLERELAARRKARRRMQRLRQGEIAPLSPSA